MSFVEVVSTVLRGWQTNKVRATLTMLGIIVGVASVVCMIAVGEGARAQINEKLRKLGTNTLYVAPGAARSGSAYLGQGTRHTLVLDDATAIVSEIPSIVVAAPLISRNRQVIAGNRNFLANIIGNDLDYLVAREWPLQSGRMFSEDEIRSGAKVALIGKLISDRLFDGQAQTDDTFRIGDVPFRVVGVLEEKGQTASGRTQDDIVMIPLAAARSRVLGGQHEISRHALDYILVKVSPAIPLASAQRKIEELLRERHRIRPGTPADFTIHNPADALAAQDASARTFGILLASIASISLVVGGISIMNIMLVAVMERTREIGLRMAVGARRRDIRNQFLFEALTFSLLGGIVGAIFGSLAAVLVASYGDWPVLISPFAILLACGFACAVGIVFGYFPALQASRLDPLVALRSE